MQQSQDQQGSKSKKINQITEEEIEVLKQAFDLFDVDKSNAIDAGEL